MQNDLLTVSEVAAYLRIGEQTIRDMIARGEMPARKFGKVWRIRRVDLEAQTGTEIKIIEENTK